MLFRSWSCEKEKQGIGREEGRGFMTVFEMAERYYPRLWGMTRLEVLVRAGRLTAEEKERLVKGAEGRA